MTIQDRFMKYVSKQENGCWIWTAAKDPKGYGRFWLPEFQKVFVSTRASWILFVGSLSADICVLHKCDVPSCVNPEHLFLGTIGDNNRDAKAKGRTKLKYDYPAIIAAIKVGYTYEEIADYYNMPHRGVVSQIVKYCGLTAEKIRNANPPQTGG